VARHLLGLAARLVPDGMRGRNFLSHFSLAGAARYLDGATLFRHNVKRRLFRPEILELFADAEPWRDALGFIAKGPDHWLSALQYLDIKTYLPLDILTKVDRMSMAHSLEARVPLLDHKLIEFAATIPPELQIREGTTKHIFRRAMRGILPSEIIERPKRGFAVPLAGWFRGPSGPFLRDLLLSGRSGQRGVFNADYIERLIARQAKGRELDWQLWMLVSFEMWFRTFLDGRPGPEFAGPSPYLVSATGA
jgi:asparagine synthase (glutamine-hydrolysing)